MNAGDLNLWQLVLHASLFVKFVEFVETQVTAVASVSTSSTAGLAGFSDHVNQAGAQGPG